MKKPFKKIAFFLSILFLCLGVGTLTSCNEQAAVKVKFYDSLTTTETTEKLLFPGSYDLAKLASEGLDDFVPEKKGYTFVKWTLDKSGTSDFDPKKYTSGTETVVNVYAQWEERAKIAYYNGSNPIGTYYFDELKTGTQTVAAPTRTGYTFVRWTTDSANTTEFVASTFSYPTDKKTVNVYAQWEKVVTIIYMNGNTEAGRVLLSALKEGTSTAPTVTKVGFNFDKWTTDTEGTTTFNPATLVTDKDTITVYAKFNAKAKVTYYDASVVLYDYYLEDITTSTPQPTPTKVGYTFVGWVDGNNAAFTVNLSATANQVAYAKWEQRALVNFYNGSTKVETKYLDELKAGTTTQPVVTKTGYSFLEWNLSENGAGVTFNPNTYNGSSKTINVYAQWERVVTVIYMNGSTEVGRVLLSALKDGTLPAPTATKAHYTFKNWTTDSAGTTPFVVANCPMTNATFTVYAQWTENVKVIYMSDNSIYQTYYLDELSAGFTNPVINKTGYTFVKWENSENEEFVLNREATVNQIAYAKWEQRAVVKYYDGNTLVETKYLDELKAGTTTQPSVTKTGYTFVEWNTSSDGEGNTFNYVAYAGTEKTINVYAKWDLIVTVVYMNGASEVNRILLSALRSGTSEPVVTKTGYYFSAWTTDLEGNTPFVYGSYFASTATVTVYAQWTEKLVVTYYNGNDVYDTKYLEDITNSYVPAEPTKTGYDFQGWVTTDDGSTSFVLDVAASSNINAYAKWEQKVTVRYYDGETLVASRYLDELKADITSAPAAPSKTGYTFIRWTVNGETFNYDTYVSAVKTVNVNTEYELIVTVIYMNGSSETGRVLLSALKAGTSTAPTATKQHYTFQGWKTDVLGTIPFVVSNCPMDNETVTVYASWTENSKVTYYVGNELYDSKYLDEIANSYVPTTPTASGKFFNTWVTTAEGSTAFVLDCASTTDLVAYATWYNEPEITGLNYDAANGRIEWNALIDATYQIKIDAGEPVSTVTVEGGKVHYSLDSSLDIGQHTAYVMITYHGHSTVWTSLSFTKQIVLSIGTPSFNAETRVISWDEPAGDGYYYDVYWNGIVGVTPVRVNTNSYTIPASIVTGSYVIYVKAYKEVNSVIISSNTDSASVTVVSVERYDETLKLFINADDRYVLMTGVDYTFATVSSITENTEYFTVTGNKITIKNNLANGTIFDVVTNLGTIHACAENVILSISPDDNWTTYQNNAKLSNVNSNSNQTGFMNITNLYEVGTGDDNYRLELNITSSSAFAATCFPLDVSGTVGLSSNIGYYLSLKKVGEYYCIDWTEHASELADGTVVSLTIKAHYVTGAQKEIPFYTYTFKVNKGVNVYTDAELRENFSDLDVKSINLHSNIILSQAELTELGIVYSNHTDTTVENPKNSIENSIYFRSSAVDDDFRLNGNYFQIDASNVNKLIGKANSTFGTYKMYYVFVAVLGIQGGGSDSVNYEELGGAVTVSKKQNASITNIKVKGNATLTTTEGSFLTDSGAIDGFISQTYATTLDNVVIYNCNEGIKLESQNNGTHFIRNNLHIVKNTAISQCWNSSTYLFTDGEIRFEDSHFYKSYSTSSTLAMSESSNRNIVFTDVDNGIYARAYPCITLDNMIFDNWAYGDEFYYQAVGFSSSLTSYKQQMDTNVKALTQDGYTLVRTNQDSTTQINMELMINGKNDSMYEIRYVKADGTVYSSLRSCKQVGDIDCPNDPRAGADPYTVLWPVGSTSSSENFGALATQLTNELTALGAQLSGNSEYATAYTNMEGKFLLDSVFGDNLMTYALTLLGQTGDETATSNLRTSTLYQYAFAQAYNDANSGRIHMEATLPNAGLGNGNDGISTILVEAIKAS